MIFPESLEDIYLVVDMYGLSEWDVELWGEMLTNYIDELMSHIYHFADESTDLNNHREEAEQYSEECSKLYQELASRIKYDENLAVTVDDLAMECALAASLALELEAQAQELNRLRDVLDEHIEVVTAYRDLLREYLGQEEGGDEW